MKKTKEKMTHREVKSLLEKWGDNFNESEKREFIDDVNVILEQSFIWGGISRAPKTVDKSMQFSFEQWLKTNK
jgi:hypothetical protein